MTRYDVYFHGGSLQNQKRPIDFDGMPYLEISLIVNQYAFEDYYLMDYDEVKKIANYKTKDTTVTVKNKRRNK